MINSYLCSEYADIAYIELKGEITSKNSDEIRGAISSLLVSERPFIIIDLTDTKKISGSALGELLEGRCKLQAYNQGDIALACPADPVDATLRDLGADKVLHIFEDRESAVNYLYWEYKGLTENLLLTIPNELSVVPAIRTLVKKCVLAKGYSTREAFQVETIVDELCNNAIEHGNHGVKGIVEVALAIGRRKIEINIANGIEFVNGEQSTPEAITRVMETYRDKPSTTIDNPRGRGLALVKMLANEFDIDSSNDGTCVHVTKYREV